jgi:hypothetical protein
MSERKLRNCTECSAMFDAGGGTRPPEVCSKTCRKKRHARHVREHYARRKAEHERLKAIMEQLQAVVAA